MRILLDECVPCRLRRELPEHEVRTVPEMGWASFENGVLLATASGKFDVLVTTDQRLSYQHKVSALAIAVVVLVAKRNKLESLLPLAPELRKVLQEVKLGEVRRVGV
jgi:predicted nuclease of predicted toxin-antitoxin system